MNNIRETINKMNNFNLNSANNMDNLNNNFNNLRNIDSLYKDLSFFDQYGSSLMLFIVITIMLLVACTYVYIMINIQPIRENWSVNRCKPHILPFAGFINKPPKMTANDFTKANFEYCTQDILKGITGNAVQPLTYIFNVLIVLTNQIKDSINNTRELTSRVRNNIMEITNDIMGRLLNIIAPLQQIIITFKDTMAKIQGIIMTSLFTLLGSYYTLKSLLGAIAQFIVKILISMIAMIIIFWIIPFTWGQAAVLSAIFVSLAIPLAIMVGFMVDVLKINPGINIPSMPRKPTLKCFDRNTLLKMNDSTYKKIEHINVGDMLFNNNIVTAKIQVLTEGSKMYKLNNTVVSDSHRVLYNGRWINVCDHPDVFLLNNYDEKYLYCLNTSHKEIIIDDIFFSDWDDINDKNVKQHIGVERNDIHKYFDGGFKFDTQIILKHGNNSIIKNIRPGDILKNGEVVYGIVQIRGEDLQLQYNYLGKLNNIVGGPNMFYYVKTVNDIQNCNSMVKPDKKFATTLDIDDKQKIIVQNDKVLYHILTDTGTFNVKDISFCDYNSCIDLLLDAK